MEKKNMSSQSKIKIFVKFKVKQMNIRERLKERKIATQILSKS